MRFVVVPGGHLIDVDRLPEFKWLEIEVILIKRVIKKVMETFHRKAPLKYSLEISQTNELLC